jgi:hypothetical protein
MIPRRRPHVYLVPPPDPLRDYLRARRRREYDEEGRQGPWVGLAVVLGLIVGYLIVMGLP